jgi:hypothetical protein
MRYTMSFILPPLLLICSDVKVNFRVRLEGQLGNTLHPFQCLERMRSIIVWGSKQGGTRVRYTMPDILPLLLLIGLNAKVKFRVRLGEYYQHTQASDKVQKRCIE